MSEATSQQFNVSDVDLTKELFDKLREQTSDGIGISRDSYGARESIALNIVEEKAKWLGLQTQRDAGANLIVTLPGREPDLPFVACGSHLDSVPQGETSTEQLESWLAWRYWPVSSTKTLSPGAP